MASKVAPAASDAGRTTTTRLSNKTRKSRRSTTSLVKQPLAMLLEKPPKPVIPLRVFLYLQLKDIENLPVVAYPLELHLYHVKSSIQKMSEHYSTETIIYQHEFNMDKPAFAMGIMQDDIEDMNIFSDNPLLVSLYQRIPRHRKGELLTVGQVHTNASGWPIKEDEKLPGKIEEAAGDAPELTNIISDVMDPIAIAEEDMYGEEDGEMIEGSLEFISRGHCDLLQLFQCKRFINNIPIRLYPEYYRKLETATTQKITTTSNWHMYSILPMLKNMHFTNLAFITLESIYNAPEHLHQHAGNLGISLSLRATRPDAQMNFKVLPLCTFYGFGSQIIDQQNIIVVWENIKRDLLGKEPLGVANVQMETMANIKVHRIFKNLLKSKGVDFKIELIDKSADFALVNNSLHRFVINAEMRKILEASVVNNDYELLLQLYDEEPSNVFYEGVINLSVFGYPEVHACRFACPLVRVYRKSTHLMASVEQLNNFELPMFLTINLCFFQPLTQRCEPLDAYNENSLKSANLRTCQPLKLPNEDISHGLKELYRNFDRHIKEQISYIVKNNVHSIEEKRGHFCCSISNLVNLLVDICGADFNVRMPTKTNIEFREMLTHMHKELMDRIIRLLDDCSWERLEMCVLRPNDEQIKMRRLLEEYRNMCFIGECVLARQVFDELVAGCNNKMLLNFYLFLNAVEGLNFEYASNYLLNQREHNWRGEYFVNLLEIYVNYKMQLKSEQIEGEAYSNMMEKLRVFTKANCLDREGWILLYCLYVRKGYMPGMEFTRWQYENLYDVPGKMMPLTPRSLYELFLPEDFEMGVSDIHCQMFFEAFKTFTHLGAYEFAEVIFTEISMNFPDIEKYLIQTTLAMLQGNIDGKFKVQKKPTNNTQQGIKRRLYQSHINGNAEFCKRNYDNAIKEFRDLLSIDPADTDLLAIFQLSLQRLARLSFDREDYQTAKQAFELCVPRSSAEKNFYANFGMGLSLYYLHNIEEAIPYLLRATRADVFMPDPWGYLATINLRLGRNKTALDCWQNAKLYPEIPLNNRIYVELDKIKYSDVCLLAEDDYKVK